MTFTLIPARRKRVAYSLYGTSAVLLAVSLGAASSLGAAAAVPGSDWGPAGALAPTDSAVSVQWNNANTPAVDQVYRGINDAVEVQPQLIPHAGSTTYDSIPSSVNSQIQQDFGGMKLSVSQTSGLRHQAVTVSVTGANIGPNAAAGVPNALIVMQCWGKPGDTQPDPSHCQDGAGSVDSTKMASRAFSSSDAPLVGDTDYKAGTGVSVVGTLSGGQMTLQAAVHAQVFVPAGHTDIASGATGTVEFLDPNLEVVGKASVSNGFAIATVSNPAYRVSAYTAEYIASPSENYLSSPRSAAATTGSYNTSPTTPGMGTNSLPRYTSGIPFTAIDGTTVAAASIGTYFTQQTTNEIGSLAIASTPSGVATRSFEVQTGAESPGLGCGTRSDMPSTSVCWLVAVPFDSSLPTSYQEPVASPLTPSLWAQRVQVQLNFSAVATSCGAGARAISEGSEMLVDAMNSWIPAVCEKAGVDLGYIQTTDSVARSQYAGATTRLVFTSKPIADTSLTSTLYAPAGLSAVTISLLSVNSGTLQPVTGIKLDARLVAKLLTESYIDGIDDPNQPGSQSSDAIPWQRNLPVSLSSDPEFRALNPGFTASNEPLGSDLIVTVAGTDATSALWQWLVSDPESRSFLEGCPDTASGNTVINPFYSARTYTDCANQAQSLDATAASWMAEQNPATNPDGTLLPEGFVYVKPSYPPAGGDFPLPGYYEREPATVNGQQQGVLTLSDMHQRENTFAGVATDVFRGQSKGLNFWCPDNVTCPGTVITPPGVWINSSAPIYGAGILGLTDGTSAARSLLPTAILCDDAGTSCVGANNQSLQAAAATFKPAAAGSHFLQPPSSPAWSKGAYPLTIPVYAEINTKNLTAVDAVDFAKVLTFLTGVGQQQGYAIGNLPPGMAPLTSTLLAQDKSAIATLQQMAVVSTPSSTPTVTPTITPSATPSVTTSSPAIVNEVPPVNSPAPVVAPVPVSTPKPVATAATPTEPAATPIAVAAGAMTPAAAVGPLPFAVGGGLFAAVICGIVAPIVGRRRKA